MERSNGRLFFHFQVMKIGLFNVTREREKVREERITFHFHCVFVQQEVKVAEIRLNTICLDRRDPFETRPPRQFCLPAQK